MSYTDDLAAIFPNFKPATRKELWGAVCKFDRIKTAKKLAKYWRDLKNV